MNGTYAGNTRNDRIPEIEGESNRVLAAVAAGKNPCALVVDSKIKELHRANLDKEAFTVIDLE